MQTILIICSFCVFKFTYFLKCIWDPQTNTWDTLNSFTKVHSMRKLLCFPGHAFSAKVEQGKNLCFSFHISCSFLIATFFAFFCFLGVILLFKVDSNCGGKVPSSVPEHRKAVMRLTEQVCTLEIWVMHLIL